MRVRTAILAIALAAGGAWGLATFGPATLAYAKEQAVTAAMRHHHLGPEDQSALATKLRAQYPELAAKAGGWIPVTAAKLESLTKAYQALPRAERAAIARDVNRGYGDLLAENPTLRQALRKQGTEQQKAEWVLNLPAGDRKAVSEDVLALWQRLETEHPKWVATVTGILSR